MARETKFYGWKLLAVFWIILFANFAFPLYGASVVNTYMAAALHWDRTQLGLAYAILPVDGRSARAAHRNYYCQERRAIHRGTGLLRGRGGSAADVVRGPHELSGGPGLRRHDRPGRDDGRSARRADGHQPVVQPTQRTCDHAGSHGRYARRICGGEAAGQSDSRV